MRGNPLAYPAGQKPGFDPTHPASQRISPGHGLSAVAVPGGMLSLLKGRPCTNNVVNVSSAVNEIGPSITSSGGASNSITDSGNAVTLDLGQTLAGIIYYQTQADNPIIIGSSDDFQGAFYLGVIGATDHLLTYVNGGTDSGITLNNNEAYFVAASNNAINIYFIVKSLKTGKVMTATQAVTGSVIFTPTSGTYTIQSDTFNNQAKFPIAAVSYTPSSLSPSQLLAWSADPWAFWYPRHAEMLVAAASTTAYAAFSLPQHSLSQVRQRIISY